MGRGPDLKFFSNVQTYYAMDLCARARKCYTAKRDYSEGAAAPGRLEQAESMAAISDAVRRKIGDKAILRAKMLEGEKRKKPPGSA